MSKEAALRAMREANYRKRTAGEKLPSKPTRPAARPAKAKPVAVASSAAPTDALCGHRSMNGRTCTREQGHTAKNHRYS
ncbi:hypothetical protein [Nocardioides ferulae]|uniref:hypothetical protein n=1 Tax=Nocardioides ferulae TaxID=2340821 RepID=UPI000EB3E8A2|nr:hypothetical protein [Nocardioides ferulae]